ncbi:MAG TPA: sigma-E factor negative regulatory protein [Gammaproteobacteria bacterium]|nr:sigma-E factor negative regulatory protein [Gammaproteobacteria bacterium]
MKDKLHEQLSALVDDELAEHERALLLKQLNADDGLQVRLARYQLASDALHNYLPQRVDPAFHTRIQAALGDAPPLRSRGTVVRSLFKSATGVAVAASVAVVAVLSLQSIREEQPDAAPVLASAPENDGTYLRADIPPPAAPLSQGLDVYLVNHNEYAVNRSMQGMLPYVRLVGQDMTLEDRK